MSRSPSSILRGSVSLFINDFFPVFQNSRHRYYIFIAAAWILQHLLGRVSLTWQQWCSIPVVEVMRRAGGGAGVAAGGALPAAGRGSPLLRVLRVLLFATQQEVEELREGPTRRSSVAGTARLIVRSTLAHLMHISTHVLSASLLDVVKLICIFPNALQRFSGLSVGSAAIVSYVMNGILLMQVRDLFASGGGGAVSPSFLSTTAVPTEGGRGGEEGGFAIAFLRRCTTLHLPSLRYALFLLGFPTFAEVTRPAAPGAGSPSPDQVLPASERMNFTLSVAMNSNGFFDALTGFCFAMDSAHALTTHGATWTAVRHVIILYASKGWRGSTGWRAELREHIFTQVERVAPGEVPVPYQHRGTALGRAWRRSGGLVVNWIRHGGQPPVPNQSISPAVSGPLPALTIPLDLTHFTTGWNSVLCFLGGMAAAGAYLGGKQVLRSLIQHMGLDSTAVFAALGFSPLPLVVPNDIKDMMLEEIKYEVHRRQEALRRQEEVEDEKDQEGNRDKKALRSSFKREAILSLTDDAVDVCICPITQTIMCDPVDTADGHTYDRDAIESWFLTNNTSPVTNIPLESLTVRPNHAIRRTVQCIVTALS